MGTHPKLITTGLITTGLITTRLITTGHIRTRNIALTIAAAASTGLLAAACSSGSPAATGTAAAASGSASAGGAALTTEKTSIGTVLANGTGMTVYWFAADHGTTSACTGACAAAWPPVTGTPSAGTGVSLPGKLAAITRPGGGAQATYNGHPLYTFEEDTAPGQVNGNGVTGFGAAWHAITLTGSAGASSSPAAKTGY